MGKDQPGAETAQEIFTAVTGEPHPGHSARHVIPIGQQECFQVPPRALTACAEKSLIIAKTMVIALNVLKVPIAQRPTASH